MWTPDLHGIHTNTLHTYYIPHTSPIVPPEDSNFLGTIGFSPPAPRTKFFGILR